ncbi:hypothetical protein C0Q70_10612 [Pomacea canaliculata]|uniref:Uncharacterized protein n=1 Tax=Pomacea canaliculata TaxID=400727 RepID=A0A2T7P3P6_POMCA|nr:hypothetical protein C0Q70_10612 [Pomacea canaliculata]
MGAFISILLDLATTAIIMIFLWCLVMWMFDSSHTENESSPEILPLQSMEDLQERLPIPVQCQEDLDALGSPGTNASVCDREQKFNTGLTESTCKATCGSDDGELQSPTVSHIDDAQYPIQSQEDVDQGVDCIAIHSNADAILDDDSSQIATSAALTNNGGGGAGEFPHETSEGTAAWLKRKPPEASLSGNQTRVWKNSKISFEPSARSPLLLAACSQWNQQHPEGTQSGWSSPSTLSFQEGLGLETLIKHSWKPLGWQVHKDPLHLSHVQQTFFPYQNWTLMPEITSVENMDTKGC